MLLCLLSCTKSDPPFAESLGYFKDDGGRRAFTFILPAKYTPEQVKAHANKQPNTPGMMTVVFYYEEQSQAIDPTLMNMSYSDILSVLSKSNFKYRYQKYPNESEYFGEKE